MGSGRDKRKKAKGGPSGQGDAKTTRKTERNAEKAERRAERRAEGGEDDLDALLAKFALEDRRKAAAGEVRVQHDAPPPSARVYASFTPVAPTQRDSDIVLFGGEWLDAKADKIYVKSELYRFHTGSRSWTKLDIPNGPAPRTAHQAVVHKGHMYVFGGELTSVNQEKFRHYRDLWRLDLQAHAWEQLPARGGPSARSGHRMLARRNRLLLFGGFYDDGKKQEYHNDVWAFDTDALAWQQLACAGPGPAPRGGCQLALHGDCLFVFGGHSVLREGREERDCVHDDVWALDLASLQWQRVRKAGMAPQPRTSFGLAQHNARAVLFGGVADRAGAGDRLYSTNFDEMYQFAMEPHLRRWFPVSLRTPKRAAAAQQADRSGPEGEGPAGAPGARSAEGGAAAGQSNAALHRAAVRIQSRYRGYAVRKAYKTYKLGGQLSELLYSPAAFGLDLASAVGPKPRARQAPLMAVVRNTLWLLGGIVEVAHADVYLDDLWCLDLAKLDGWTCVRENTEGEEVFRDLSDWATDEGSSDSGDEA